MTTASDEKGRVRAYWEAEPCGTSHSSAPEGSREFFGEIERQRDEAEPYVGLFADFAGARGKKVLEIGTGAGTDFIRFARADAEVTGIDLTEHAVALARDRLRLEGLKGTTLTADAEALPFARGSFDRVYSWGVLHHTPDTPQAIREAIRVLRPGGELCVMLYGRFSWVAWTHWVRFALLRGRPWRSVEDVLSEHMESAGTKAYTARELRRLFAGLKDLRVDPVLTIYDIQCSRGLARPFGDRFGWFLVVRGRASAS